MKKFWIYSLFCLLISFTGRTQEINLTNTDDIYALALREYREGKFQKSLHYTNRGLSVAPEYHDIRILQIRNNWALNNFEAADRDLEYLLTNAPEYPDVKPLALQRINRFENPEEALRFIERAGNIFPGQPALEVRKAQILHDAGGNAEARRLALSLMRGRNLSGEDRYILQQILNRTIKNEIGVNYQYISFSEAYTNYVEWHTISAEFQHNFNHTAVIGRVNYSDRAITQGTLYELEAYPVFSDRFYAFANVGFSDGSVFPDFRGSLSGFYNFAKVFEGELGIRLLQFNNNGYFSGIAGLTAYWGAFYFNGRAFLGPERLGQMTRNYQFNIRYYFGSADNFLFARIGNGISPDERIIFTQALENPELQANYINAGINFSLGSHHLLQIGGGFLGEEIASEKRGSQLNFNTGYRYRF